MASPPEIGVLPKHAPGDGGASAPSGSHDRPGPIVPSATTTGPGKGLALLALLCIYLSHPLTWLGLADDPPARLGGALWSPPAGFALVLVAWFGLRACAIVVACCGALLLVQHVLLDLLANDYAQIGRAHV